MMLPDHIIKRLVADGHLGISPFDPARVQPASVDLTLARDLRVPRPSVTMIDTADVQPGHTMIKTMTTGYWDVGPGDFLLASTVETVTIPPELIGHIDGKSSLGRLGLAVHITAGLIDPGFTGQITLEIVNHAPYVLRLRAGMPIAQLSVTSMWEAPEHPYGEADSHYQGQSGTVESRYRLP